jgi:hypothetical protein
MDEIPVGIVVAIILAAVAMLICLVTLCAVRCFRPQNTRGPEWYTRKDGKEQLVKAPFRNDRDPSDDGRNWLRVKGQAGA